MGRRFCRQQGSALRHISSSTQLLPNDADSPGTFGAIAPAASELPFLHLHHLSAWPWTVCACFRGKHAGHSFISPKIGKMGMHKLLLQVMFYLGCSATERSHIITPFFPITLSSSLVLEPAMRALCCQCSAGISLSMATWVFPSMLCKEDFKSLLAAPAQALQENCQGQSILARRVPGQSNSQEYFK